MERCSAYITSGYVGTRARFAHAKFKPKMTQKSITGRGCPKCACKTRGVSTINYRRDSCSFILKFLVLTAKEFVCFGVIFSILVIFGQNCRLAKTFGQKVGPKSGTHFLGFWTKTQRVKRAEFWMCPKSQKRFWASHCALPRLCMPSWPRLEARPDARACGSYSTPPQAAALGRCASARSCRVATQRVARAAPKGAALRADLALPGQPWVGAQEVKNHG